MSGNMAIRQNGTNSRFESNNMDVPIDIKVRNGLFQGRGKVELGERLPKNRRPYGQRCCA